MSIFFKYNFQWMNPASQFESCMAVCSRSSWAWQFLEHIFHKVWQQHLRCGGIFNNHLIANLLLNQTVKEFW